MPGDLDGDCCNGGTGCEHSAPAVVAAATRGRDRLRSFVRVSDRS